MSYDDRNKCGNFIKYGVFITNFLIFIGGAVVFGLGVYTIVDKGFIIELLGTNLFSGALYVLVVTSAIVCILAFVGCTGAAKEIKSMILCYLILIFLVFVMMLLGGILGYVFKEKVSYTMKQEMDASVSHHGRRREVTKAWDETQTRLRCCGVKGYHDWRNEIPDSCCLETYGGQHKPCRDNPTSGNIHERGCLEISSRFIRDTASVIFGAGIFVAILMLFGMAFSFAFFKTIE